MSLCRCVAAAVVAAVFSSACVTEQPSNARTQTPANLGEAAKINAQLGVDYARQGRFDVAEEKLRRAVEQDSNYAPAHTALAYVLAQRGDNAEAEREYRRSLALDASDPGTHNNFGVLLCAQGKTAEADREFKLALQDHVYETPEAAWTNAGICARKAGDPDRAEEDFRQALKLKPEFTDALSEIATLAYNRKDWLRTRAFVQRYERVAKPTPELLLIAANTERMLGDADAARQYEIKLLREFPESDQAIQLLRKSSAP
ncbi:MAG: type IV pilus biogenesis/stability protein PilW [Nevskia sp.]